jgi:hypothetical protein
MSVIAGIVAAIVILVPVIVYLGLLIWGAIQDGRAQR